MSEFYAHSPKEKEGIPAQTYAAHIQNVYDKAVTHARAVCGYATRNSAELLQAVKGAACFHDLGKLHPENQKILSGEQQAPKLPLPHWDAGAALLLPKNQVAAAAIYSHHIGYTDFSYEKNKGNSAFRDTLLIDKTDQLLTDLEGKHRQAIELCENTECSVPIEKNEERSVFLRLVLSCLTDADHTDTAVNYGNLCENQEKIPLYPQKRLDKLDEYIAEKQSDDPRNLLRSEMYDACKNAQIQGCIASCDSPVGSGKTTAVMANLLAQAKRRGLRRIFVVLPFTNIIKQSVEVYRKALVLPGENPEDVVAELHHRADFENENARHLTSLWRAPIIVTTAVSFFETLASKTPSALRRLHELPGSAIFVDESHAALPARLLPMTWKWINCYGNSWGCYWVMASGSLCRFWNIREIADGNSVLVPEIVKSELRQELSAYETNRVVYRYDLMPKNTSETASWISKFPGPRLLIVNTVQSAAVIADYLKTFSRREKVEHLSTALTPEDREKTLQRVKKRLRDSADTDWTFVATSCVEAGVDLSFCTGFRELSSLCSLLQAAGRINREGKITNAEMWSFCLAEDSMLKANPGMKDSAHVLRSYFEEDKGITPSLCTMAIETELRLAGEYENYKNLVKDESSQRFPLVESGYQVIKSNTRIAVVNAELAKKIRFGKMDWRELQKHSVQIAKYKLDEVRAPMVIDEKHNEIYHWNLGYDGFLGYMAGIVRLKKLEGAGMIILFLTPTTFLL